MEIQTRRFGDGDYRIYIVAPMGDYWIESRETTVKLYGAQGRIAKMLGEHTYGDAQLMVDAPLLLEEVKRLQGILTNTVAGKGSALTGKGNIVDIIQIRGGSENHGENVHFTVMYEGGQVLSGWLEYEGRDV